MGTLRRTASLTDLNPIYPESIMHAPDLVVYLLKNFSGDLELEIGCHFKGVGRVYSPTFGAKSSTC